VQLYTTVFSMTVTCIRTNCRAVTGSHTARHALLVILRTTWRHCTLARTLPQCPWTLDDMVLLDGRVRMQGPPTRSSTWHGH
jgi:hypothetical protein